MGIALWLLCGVTVFAIARWVPAGRPSGFGRELIVALVVSFAAGLGASLLDFGGWAELDWRAGVFVTACSFAAIGFSRSIALAKRSAA